MAGTTRFKRLEGSRRLFVSNDILRVGAKMLNLQDRSKMLNYRIDGNLFVYIIFQASSGRELDQNKELPSIL